MWISKSSNISTLCLFGKYWNGDFSPIGFYLGGISSRRTMDAPDVDSHWTHFNTLLIFPRMGLQSPAYRGHSLIEFIYNYYTIFFYFNSFNIEEDNNSKVSDCTPSVYVGLIYWPLWSLSTRNAKPFVFQFNKCIYSKLTDESLCS